MTTAREPREMNMVEARKELMRLPEELSADPATVTVTRRGKPVLAIMTWDDYEALTETLAILSDDEALRDLRRSIQDVRTGKTLAWDDAKARL